MSVDEAESEVMTVADWELDFVAELGPVSDHAMRAPLPEVRVCPLSC